MLVWHRDTTWDSISHPIGLAFSVLLCTYSVAVAAPASAGAPAAAASQGAPQGTQKVAPQQNSSQAGAKQQAPGAVRGKVELSDDKSPIGKAVVVLSGPGHRREVETADDGTFLLDNVRPGEWTVTVSVAGMLAQSHKVHVSSDATVDIDFSMESIEVADVMRVTGERTLIHPDRIGNTTHLDKKYLEEIGSGNDLRKVIETTPGIQPDSLGNIITRGEHNAVNYTIDGAILPEAAGVLQQGQFASPRSLQSVDVDIGGYQARDGGGPMGAIVRMKSMPLQSKPTFQIGTQIGGPMSGGINFYGSSALSQNEKSVWNRVRVESSGSIFASKLGLQPGTRRFVRDAKFDLNILNKVEFNATERDRLTLIAGINESYMHQPTSPLSRRFGVRIGEHDRQNYVMLSYRHRFQKFFDEANLHIINAFYSQHIWQPNVFDPDPVINGSGALRSAAVNAKRFNYALSVQGDISKTAYKTHHLVAGFLSEIRPVKTHLSETVYNADRNLAVSSQTAQDSAKQTAISNATAANAALQTQADQASQAAISDAINGGASATDAAAAGAAAAQGAISAGGGFVDANAAGTTAAAAVPVIPYGAKISPFTGLPGGPDFTPNIGNYHGFRYIQSAYLQDTWKPDKGWLKRLTLDGGVRFDLDHGAFGNSMGIAQTVASIPGTLPFNAQPFQKQSLTNAQVSGRYGGSFAITKSTVIRSSFSNIFVPAPIDLFLTPFDVSGGPSPVNGIFQGSPRPLQAMRGQLLDAGIEQQIGPRFSMRHNGFYKKLYHFGDSGVIDNSIVYNRLTNNAQESYGYEMRLDLKPSRDGTGFYGYVSNTLSVAYLRGSRKNDGGFWDVTTDIPTTKYPDHDKRETMQAALGFRNKSNFWVLASVTSYTGVKDGRNLAIYGPHPARVKPLYLVGLNAGIDIPQRLRKNRPYMPSSVEVRIENLTNNVAPINLGSPFQGTRYTLPMRVLAGINWKV